MKPLCLLVACLLLAGCTGVSIRTDADPAANFSKYRRYAWAPGAPLAEQPGPSVNEAIHRTVDAGLAAKGIRRAENPDFIVTPRIATKDQVAVYQRTEWVGYSIAPRYAGRRGYYAPAPLLPLTWTELDQYTVGRLFLDFVDARTGKLVWRGEAVSIVGSPAQNVRNIEDAVPRMLAKFPPGPPAR